MIYRIDHQYFLTHAIDYFPQKTLAFDFSYVILSASGVGNSGRLSQVTKPTVELYPDIEAIDKYKVEDNYPLFEKMYHEYLDRKPESGALISSQMVSIHRHILTPYLRHKDIMIVCHREENFIAEAFASYLAKRFQLEVINLNKLFKKGHTDSIRIDYNATHDLTVKVRKLAKIEEERSNDSTTDGRKYLVEKKWSKKEKIKKLKELGVKITDESEDVINSMLMNVYVYKDND